MVHLIRVRHLVDYRFDGRIRHLASRNVIQARVHAGGTAFVPIMVALVGGRQGHAAANNRAQRAPIINRHTIVMRNIGMHLMRGDGCVTKGSFRHVIKTRVACSTNMRN